MAAHKVVKRAVTTTRENDSLKVLIADVIAVFVGQTLVPIPFVTNGDAFFSEIQKFDIRVLNLDRKLAASYAGGGGRGSKCERATAKSQ
ncbi:MAG: hypothetical protein AAGF45_02995 [Pseudomonadota bacterium]